jgi:putative tryptophan/tyrosine transport system substrate-binding protein
VPRLARVGFVFNPEIYFGTYFTSVEATAAQHAVRAIRIPVRNTTEIEHAIEAFAVEPNGGLIVPPPSLAVGADRAFFDRLTVLHRLPTIEMSRLSAAEGGLISYGPVFAEQFRLSASYVDRILRGAKPSELPVQFPAKFELVINLKTAKAIGLTIPESFLLRADEVIE